MKIFLDGEYRDATQSEISEITAQQAIDSAPRQPTSADVNGERDRRIAENFVFNGKPFDFDAMSKQRVTGAATLARFAVAAGAQPGDLRWMDPGVDFTWIAGDNTLVTMDAATCAAFGDAAALHEQDHIFAAHAVKIMSPIPADFADDFYWP